ncbi:sugar ABC transporter permease [Kiloniella litopenaei]|uniref:Sugar ABC transporter permease n=1 Tax=Kiloniella litopenaei TaxID=1549748 RepID=A0A0M2R9P7_9PROT|nr:ABC transporter permease [Kiloniella litopenaei]KKJ78567.1 sugar ABC transporter permease [Kiloniella litopenaei]
MKLVLEKRSEHSEFMTLMSPLLAIALTVFTGAIIFAVQGLNPFEALYVYFIEPVTSVWSLEEVFVKAAPLILIGAGLSVCYMANVWNIGAEGQLTMGAIVGSIVPIVFTSWQSPLALVTMITLGALGGALYAAIPAFLKNRFNANEILTSLMMVYIAQLFLDWVVRGPWKDPKGFNFPQSIAFEGWQLLPTLGDGRVHIGIILAIIVVVILTVLMSRTLKGFEILVIGNSPRAGRFAGFSRKKIVWFCLLLSGGLAGIAGIGEVAGPSGQLQPTISPGYGFTAIIVAFLGRLNPIGVLFAGVMLAITYIGGEAAQIDLGVSDKTAQVFQGILLFYILACDTLILYRIKMLGSTKQQSVAAE